MKGDLSCKTSTSTRPEGAPAWYLATPVGWLLHAVTLLQRLTVKGSKQTGKQSKTSLPQESGPLDALAEKVVRLPDFWTEPEQSEAVCRAFGLIWHGAALLQMLPVRVINGILYDSPVGRNVAAAEILRSMESQLAGLRQAIEDDFKYSQQ